MYAKSLNILHHCYLCVSCTLLRGIVLLTQWVYKLPAKTKQFRIIADNVTSLTLDLLHRPDPSPAYLPLLIKLGSIG